MVGWPLALVDPNGLLMLSYPEGYSAQGIAQRYRSRYLLTNPRK